MRLDVPVDDVVLVAVEQRLQDLSHVVAAGDRRGMLVVPREEKEVNDCLVEQ